jgi:two-component system, cell cycle sensor histidine kinase and response regulator CckA
MMIQKRHRDSIRAATWSTREWRVLALSLITSFMAALVGVAINFNHAVAEFFRPHANQPLVQFLVNFLVVWLVVLLLASYLRWRRAALKNEELEDIVDSISPDVMIVVDPQRNIIMTSASVLRMFGHDPNEILGRKTDLLYGDRRSLPNDRHEIYDTLEREGFHVGLAKGIRKDGRTFPLEIISGILKMHGGSVMLLRDITERKHAEELLLDREVQLRQSQKMEALGLLAGGVAHDFNNLLTSILGFGTLALESLPAGHPAQADLKEVLHSAERAAKLTTQLLAVGRKQKLEIVALNLNDAVDGMILLLKRTLGEDVILDVKLDSETGSVEADLGGIEQVLLNLAVNARDAMPQGGTLLIQTRKIILDDVYCRTHVAVEPGTYGMLVVHDSGIGMQKDVKDHIFEPFFTTKGAGKGTGLGLSLVYGIVRQCGGYVEVDSHPGSGTEFRIFFRTRKQGDIVSVPAVSSSDLKGTERLLVVEDDDAVRGFGVRVLTGMGYQVVEARSPGEALQYCRDNKGGIDLILADVVLPGMSGSDLVNRIREFSPSTRVLYVTGFDAALAIQHGVDPARDVVVMKPFSQELLAAKVRQVLGSEGKRSASHD